MSNGLSPKLPLMKDPQDGYALNKNYVEMSQQNLKMLILTAPGERIMEPSFGVGLRNYLFRNNIEQTKNNVIAIIRTQVSTYMPFIEVMKIDLESRVIDGHSENGIFLNIEFKIIPIDFISSIEINTSLN